MAGQSTPATVLLTQRKVPHTVHSYHHDQQHESYGAEAAEMLGISAGRVFKTLIVNVDGALAVAMVPVNRQLDLKAFAAALRGKRAKLADTSVAERTTGYVAGGISPLGQRKRLPLAIDASAQQFTTMFCSAGRRGLEIELAPGDLAQLADAVFAPIATS